MTVEPAPRPPAVRAARRQLHDAVLQLIRAHRDLRAAQRAERRNQPYEPVRGRE